MWRLFYESEEGRVHSPGWVESYWGRKKRVGPDCLRLVIKLQCLIKQKKRHETGEGCVCHSYAHHNAAASSQPKVCHAMWFGSERESERGS